MRAVVGKKASVVRIDSARRRLRPEPARPARPRFRLNAIAIVMASVFASGTIIWGARLAFEQLQRGEYRTALLALLPLMIVAAAPLALLLIIRGRRLDGAAPPRRPEAGVNTLRVRRRSRL